MKPGTKPVIALVSTGGTITAIGRDRLELASYLENSASVPAGRLLESLPEAASLAVVRELEYPRVASHALTHDDWIRLLETLRDLASDAEVTGIVVTHGTNTLEETAYFLSLTLPAETPVVIVGAMRPASALSADGPLNLMNAIRVASSPKAAGRGVLVVMNDTIYDPRDVTKGLTYRVHSFTSPDAGPVGYADADGQVIFHHRSERRSATGPVFELASGCIPRVDVVVSYVGADGAMIDAAVAAGASGIVSAGTGAGRPTPAELDALTRASRTGVVVCQSSRVTGGRVAPTRTTEALRFVAADSLGPWKARVLLALALTTTKDPAEIQAYFDRF